MTSVCVSHTEATLAAKKSIQDFDVFLCYNSNDKAAVKQIAEALLEKKILPWLDEWEIAPGERWQRVLEQQIGTVKSAAVFIGPSGIGPWQNDEIDAFLREFHARHSPVIPVLLPNLTSVPNLPVFLRAMHRVDFRMKESDPVSQLIWGITGLRPESTEPRR